MISLGVCFLPSAVLAVLARDNPSSKEMTCSTWDGVSASSMSSRSLTQRCVKQRPALGEFVEHGLQLARIDARSRRPCAATLLPCSSFVALLLLLLQGGAQSQQARRGCIAFVGQAVRRHACRLRGSRLPDILHKALALLAQDALNPADGVALAVEQVANAAQQIDVLRTVEAPAAAALHRPDLVEAALPEPQHMLRNFKLGGNFADGAECVWCLVHVACSLVPRFRSS